MVIKMSLRVMVVGVFVASLASCQGEPRSTVQGLEWRVATTDVGGAVSVSDVPLVFMEGLKSQIGGRGLSIEEFGNKLLLRAEMDLLVGERFLKRGDYRMSFVLGRRGASLDFRPVAAANAEARPSVNVGLRVREDVDAPHPPRFRWVLPSMRPHEAQLELIGDGLRLELSVVAMPRLVEKSRLTNHAEQILRDAEQFSLVALVPSTGPKPEIAADKPSFHGFEISGEARVRKPEVQKEVMDAISGGIRSSDGSVAGCFIPRHGIRAFHQGRFIDLVICYQCLHMQVFAGKEGPHEVVLTADVSRKLNALFEREGVKVAPR